MAVDIYTKTEIRNVIASLAVDIPAYGPGYATALLKLCLAFGIPTVEPSDTLPLPPEPPLCRCRCPHTT